MGEERKEGEDVGKDGEKKREGLKESSVFGR